MVFTRQKRFATSRMELGTCYLDCVFQTAGATSADGKLLDTNKLLQVLVSETPGEPESVAAVTSAVMTCITELSTGTMRIRTPTINNCSTVPSAIMLCIHMKFFYSCPATRFTNSQPCTTLRDYLKRCPINI